MKYYVGKDSKGSQAFWVIREHEVLLDKTLYIMAYDGGAKVGYLICSDAGVDLPPGLVRMQEL